MSDDAYEYDESRVMQWDEGNVPAETDKLSIVDTLNFMGKFFDYAREKQITKREIERIHAMRDIAITKILKDCERDEIIINQTFAERRRALEKMFEVVDKGLETHDYQFVNAGLMHITAIVKDNPAKLFLTTTAPQRHNMLEDGDLSVE